MFCVAAPILRMLELCAHLVSVFFSVNVQISNYHDSLHATFKEQLVMNPPGLYIICIIYIKAIVFRVGESYLRMVG